MKRFLKIGCIALIIAAFFGLAIYLPEVDAGILENRYINQSILVKQDKQEEGIHYDLPLMEKLSILSSMDAPVFSTEILSIHSITNLEEQDEALLEGLERELSVLEQAGVIPQLAKSQQLKESFDEALYYNISSVESSGAAVSVWKLTFYREGEFGYRFVIDASTYKIYSVCIYGYGISEFIEEINFEDLQYGQMEDIGYIVGEKLKEYYEADEYMIMGIEEWFILNGQLNYWSLADGQPDNAIPCNMYYYPSAEYAGGTNESLYKSDMEGMFIGVANGLEEMSRTYFMENAESNGK